MSGLRTYNFREGDRSEYLANYLLSGLGLVTPVPRQEDIGFDFYCQLADQETGNLSFGFPFILQVKSDSVNKITYGETDPNKWKAENINWLFRLELPLFIGIVDKKGMKLSFYNTSPLNFIFFENPNPTMLELIPRMEFNDSDVGRPTKEAIENWPKDKGDGYKYTVDLCNPFLTIDNDDIYNHGSLTAKKTILRKFIILEQQNQRFRSLNIPHFYWTLKIKPNEDMAPAWIYMAAENPVILESLFFYLGPGIISLAINLKQNKQTELALQLKPYLARIPTSIVPSGLKDAHPDLFE